MKRISISRPSSVLPGSLGKRVANYAMAAGAAGVALTALAASSEAEVIYTPVNQTVGHDASYSIDLNGDGIVDFLLTEHAYKDGAIQTFQVIALEAANGNQVVCPSSFCISGESITAALKAGSLIGPNIRPKGFFGGRVPLAEEFTDTATGGIYYYGEWTNAGIKYAGLKFKIDGAYHYGWARMSVRFNPGKGPQRTFVAQLTGFAYETVAGKPIKAGATSGNAPEEDAVFVTPAKSQSETPTESASLASLALGANGMALWRK